MAGKKRIAFLEKYRSYLRQAEFKVPAEAWLALSLGMASASGTALFIVITVLSIPISPLLAFIVFFVVADIMLGYPYLTALGRINAIEEMLPDALKQMADTLKAGGTYEFALREIATAQYGPLTKEMDLVLRKLEEGENLENSLKGFADNIDSRLIKRSIAVIIDSIKAGAGLAEVLDEIAEDIRAMHRIEQERKTETSLQVMFMVAAGAIVAPIILGLVSTIIQLFIQAASGLGISMAERAEALATKDLIVFLMQLYILVEVTASSIMVSLMRNGTISKSIIYIPVLLLISYVVYYASAIVSNVAIGGLT
jgi:pilus assembly protein TadC